MSNFFKYLYLSVLLNIDSFLLAVFIRYKYTLLRLCSHSSTPNCNFWEILGTGISCSVTKYCLEFSYISICFYQNRSY